MISTSSVSLLPFLDQRLYADDLAGEPSWESFGWNIPTSDNCLVLGADAMSSIQHSATTELPSTPQNPTLCASSLLTPPLIESIVTVALHDIDLSKEVHYSEESGIFGKSIYPSWIEGYMLIA
jgi:hypothetical protein